MSAVASKQFGIRASKPLDAQWSTTYLKPRKRKTNLSYHDHRCTCSSNLQSPAHRAPLRRSVAMVLLLAAVSPVILPCCWLLIPGHDLQRVRKNKKKCYKCWCWHRENDEKLQRGRQKGMEGSMKKMGKSRNTMCVCVTATKVPTFARFWFLDLNTKKYQLGTLELPTFTYTFLPVRASAHKYKNDQKCTEVTFC